MVRLSWLKSLSPAFKNVLSDFLPTENVGLVHYLRVVVHLWTAIYQQPMPLEIGKKDCQKSYEL